MIKGKSLLNLFLYGCGSKSEYDMIREDRDRFNYSVWHIVTVVMFFIFVTLFASTITVDVVRANSWIYAVLSVVSLFSWILLLTVAKPGSKLMLPIIYFLSASLIAFGIVIGTILSPQYLAATYHVMLICIPMVIVDKPFRMSIMGLISTIVFIVFCTMYKTGDTQTLDIYNAIAFFGVGQFVNFYMNFTRMDFFIASKKIELASMSDDLTGLYNRKAYEYDIENLTRSGLKEDVVYAAFDVNGLKLANDNLGHSAGDELLKGTADCIKQCFGAYGKTYRTGGDEFAAIIHVDEDQLAALKKDFNNLVLRWKGSIVDYLSVSTGYITMKEFRKDSIYDMAKVADQRMYTSKAEYYKSNGVDRRGQQDALSALCALYTKILKVNLTIDSYQIISMDASEQTAIKGFSDSIYEWMEGFGKSGQVHPDDVEYYLKSVSRENLDGYFNTGKRSFAFSYRRLFDGIYKRVVLELVPAGDYSEENQSLYMYIKNIE